MDVLFLSGEIIIEQMYEGTTFGKIRDGIQIPKLRQARALPAIPNEHSN